MASLTRLNIDVTDPEQSAEYVKVASADPSSEIPWPLYVRGGKAGKLKGLEPKRLVVLVGASSATPGGSPDAAGQRQFASSRPSPTASSSEI